jgi:large repetitive protein
MMCSQNPTTMVKSFFTYGVLLFFSLAGCFANRVAAQNRLSFNLTQAAPQTVNVGDTLNLDVVVHNFDSIVSFQYTMEWDETLLQYAGLTNITVPDQGNFLSYLFTPSQLTVGWNTGNGTFRTVANGTTIYRLRLKARSAGTYWTRLMTSNTAPTPVEIIKYPSVNVLPTIVNFGTLPNSGTTALTVVATPSSGSTVNSGDAVFVDVTTRNFVNIVTAQWAMQWNSAALRFDSITALNRALPLDNSFLGISEAATGNLYFAWNSSQASSTLPDDAVLFRLCFRAIGAAGTSSNLSFVSANGTTIEVFKATNTGNISVLLANQNATINIQGATNNSTDLKFYPVRTIAANAATEVCIPIRADNFTGVAGFQGSIRFDSTKLTFVRVQNLNSTLTAFNINDIITTPTRNPIQNITGTVRYLWVHPQLERITLPIASTLFEICVNPTSLAQNDSAFVNYINDPVKTLAFDETASPIVARMEGSFVVMPSVSVLPITVTGAVTPVKCNGGTDGAIALTVGGGTGTFTYAWTGANNFTSTNKDITGLRAGRYVVATTSGNVTKNDTFDIAEPTQLAVTQAVTNINCAGMATGSITMTVSGGTAPYTYLWSNSATSRDISNIAAGPYSVTVTDANQCRLTPATPLVVEPAVLTVEVAAATNVTCNGANNGEIRLTVTGGTPPFSMRWAGPNGFSSTTQNLVNLAAGSYTVTVTDSRQCAKTSQPIVIIEPAVLALGTPSTTASNCGQANGTASVTPTGGTTPYQYAWTGPNGFTATTASLTGLRAGNYAVTVTDGNNCTINNSNPISVSDLGSTLVIGVPIVTSASCGQSNGAISVAVTGGVAPVTYAWTGANNFTSTQLNITNLAAGNYILTALDANNCSTTQNVTVGTQNATLNITPTIVHTRCGLANGTVSTSVTGATGNVTYRWTGPNGFTSTDANLASIIAGAYQLTVTDGSGCTASIAATVNSSTALTVPTPTTTAATCGQSNGTISIGTVTGSTGGPYTFTWSNSATTQNLTGLAAGTYTVTVQDAVCSQTASATVNSVNSNLVIGAPNVVFAQCGLRNGSINVTISGGTPPLTYAWTGANNFTANTLNINNLGLGTYNLLVTDATNCTATLNSVIVLDNPSTLTVGTPAATTADCGQNNGTISLTVSGGTQPYTYQWSGANNFTATTQNLTGLGTGAYLVTITDNVGCSVTASANVITGNSGITINNPSLINVRCNGGADGTIIINPTGGVAPYLYAWTGPNNFSSTTKDLTGLRPGSYTVVVTDSRGCTYTSTALNISQPESSLTARTTMNNVLCRGENTGGVFLEVFGGTPPYTYLWSGGDRNINIQNAHAATYSVTITDFNGCTFSPPTATVTEPAEALTFGAPNVTNITCFGAANGAISINVLGGVLPYQYAWTGPNGFTSSNLTIDRLLPGTYQLRVQDANGCIKTQTFNITQPTAGVNITGISSDANGGRNGSITTTPTGGTTPYSYVWSNGSTAQNLTSLAPGTYSVTVTDANRCTASNSFIINGNTDSLIINVLRTLHAGCPGQSLGLIEVNVQRGTAPFTYEWREIVSNRVVGTNNANISNLGAGQYQLKVTDSQQTVGLSQIVTVRTAAQAIRVDSLIAPETCLGRDGSIDLSVNPSNVNYNYRWSDLADNIQDRFGVRAGTYSVTVTGEYGCQAILPALRVPYNPCPLTATIRNTSNIDCYGGRNGKISFTIEGGDPIYRIAWNGGRDSVNPPSRNGFYEMSNLTAGTYRITITDVHGQTVQKVQEITQPDSVRILYSVQPDNGSRNGSITLTVNGGTPAYAYQWNSGERSRDLFNLEGCKSYSVTVTDSKGCLGYSQNIYVSCSNPDTMRITRVNITPVNCQGDRTGSVNIEVAGGVSPYQYLWKDLQGNPVSTSPSLTGVGSGVYTLNLSDSRRPTQAFLIQIFNVSTLSNMVVGVSTLPSSGLTDGSAAVTVTGGLPRQNTYTYAWSAGSATADGKGATGFIPGSYTVSVSDSLCTVVKSFTIAKDSNVNGSQVQIRVLSNYNGYNLRCFRSCDGVATVLDVPGGTAPFRYEWETGETKVTAEQLCVGANKVTVTDATGRKFYGVTPLLTQPNELNVNVLVTQPTGAGAADGSARAVAMGGVGTYDYLWSDKGATRLSDVDKLLAGKYSVLVTDRNGCSVTKSDIVLKSDTTTYCLESSPIMSVNVEKDGKNDYFRIRRCDFKTVGLQVFNRWGQLVFETDDYNDEWDGKDRNGKLISEGGYFYIIRAGKGGGRVEIRRGTITVLRDN